jgi:hypothetical protein
MTPLASGFLLVEPVGLAGPGVDGGQLLVGHRVVGREAFGERGPRRGVRLPAVVLGHEPLQGDLPLLEVRTQRRARLCVGDVGGDDADAVPLDE